MAHLEHKKEEIVSLIVIMKLGVLEMTFMSYKFLVWESMIDDCGLNYKPILYILFFSILVRYKSYLSDLSKKKKKWFCACCILL